MNMMLTAAMCTQCGASIEVDKRKEAAVCSHCGSAFIVQKAINNYTSQIHAQVVHKTVNVYGADTEEFVVRGGTLEKYNGASTEVIIPDGVKKIGDECFMNLHITSVIIPHGVTHIGNKAFWNCDSIKIIALPESVVSIGDYAFANCDNLEEINLPESVTSVGVGAFSRCKKLANDILDSFVHYKTEELSRKCKKEYTKAASVSSSVFTVIIIVFYALYYLLFR